MSRHSLALVAIFLVAVGIRLTYSVTTGHTLRMTPRDGQMAHNILANGRWFELNTKPTNMSSTWTTASGGS